MGNIRATALKPVWGFIHSPHFHFALVKAS